MSASETRPQKPGEASPSSARGPGASDGPPESFDRSWGEPITMRVEYGKVREFARAIKDASPAYAGDGALAPPAFLMTIGHWIEGGIGRMRNRMLDYRLHRHGEPACE